MCEKRISDYDQHMANTYDLPSAINEIICRAERAEAERDELARQFEQAQREIKYLRSTDHAADIAAERMFPVDRGYSESETPFGIALDGGGDEVEG